MRNTHAPPHRETAAETHFANNSIPISVSLRPEEQEAVDSIGRTFMPGKKKWKLKMGVGEQLDLLTRIAEKAS